MRMSICLRATAPCAMPLRRMVRAAEAAALSEFRAPLGHGRDVRCGAPRQREHPEAQDFRHQGLPPRHGRIPSRLSRLHGRKHEGWPARLDLDRRWIARGSAIRGRASGALFHGGAGRERTHVPDHDDARLRRRTRGRAVDPEQTDRQDHIAHLRRKLPAVVGKGLDHARHGHDRETGRHRRAREYHDRACLRARATPSPGTSGSCRRRCATPSWCWHRRRAGSPAS